MLTKSAQFQDDSLAPLGWAATLTIAALEKLLEGEEIDETEEDAIRQVASEVDDLSNTSRQPLGEFLTGERAWPPALRRNFSTLLAIQPSVEERKSCPLDAVAVNLKYVVEWIRLPLRERTNLDRCRVEEAQNDCLKILRQLSPELLQGDEGN